MHAIKHDLRHALQDANYAEKHTNPGLIGWIHLGELNYADLRDQSDPQHKHLAEVLLQRGKCGVGEHKAAVRQFFMNLACSDPSDPEQLEDYQSDPAHKKIIHTAYDAAVYLLGHLHSKVTSAADEAELDNIDEPVSGGRAGAGADPAAQDITTDKGPSVDEIIEAAYNSVEANEFMQDAGAQIQKTRKRKTRETTTWITTYPQLDAEALKMRKAIGKLGACPFLPQNATRLKELIAIELNLKRSKKDLKILHKSVTEHFAKENPRAKEMYVFYPEEKDCGGLKIVLRNLFQSLRAKHEKQKTQIRVPNDALRVAATMLDPTCRNGCAEWMSNLKSKDFLNQSTSPRTALVEKMVKDFNNPNYVARSPAKAELVQSKSNTKLDPNDVSTLPQCYHGQVFTNQVCIFLFVALPY